MGFRLGGLWVKVSGCRISRALGSGFRMWGLEGFG